MSSAQASRASRDFSILAANDRSNSFLPAKLALLNDDELAGLVDKLADLQVSQSASQHSTDVEDVSISTSGGLGGDANVSSPSSNSNNNNNNNNNQSQSQWLAGGRSHSGNSNTNR